MKHITEYIKEDYKISHKTKNTKRIFNITLREWFQWFFGEEMFKGEITDEMCEDDASLDANCEDLNMSPVTLANFLNKHMDDKIELEAHDIGNCIENSFTVDGKEILMDSIAFYGEEIE